MDDILARYAGFATRLSYADLPPAVVQAARMRLLDTLGCAVSAHDSHAGAIGRRLAPPPAPGTISGRILGTSTLVAADAAAFASTCMIRDLDLNDDYPGGHPSDALGALLAIAPTLGVPGERLITSVVVAYEVIISLLRKVPLRDLGWDQSIAIAIGTAAGLSSLLGLDREAAGHAISITTVANPALRATRAGQLSMWKGAATAYAVRNAVFGVQLARAGMTGPESPFTGRHGLVEMIAGSLSLDPLGGAEQDYFIQDVYTKYWPVAYSLQALVWAGVELRKQVAPADLAAIEVHTYAFSIKESGSEPAKWDPRTRETADHSIPYVLVRSLVHGRIDHAAFEADAYLDPALRPLMQMVTVHVDDEVERDIRNNIVRLRIVARDRAGRTHRVEILNPLGHEKNPLAPAQMAERFTSLCEPVLGAARTAQALQAWSAIEAAGNVQPAFDALQVAQDA